MTRLIRIITDLVPELDVAGGLNAISDNCSCALFKLIWAVLTSAASARSFRLFFSNIGSSMLRQPIHLQFAEHGILAWKNGIYNTKKVDRVQRPFKN